MPPDKRQALKQIEALAREHNLPAGEIAEYLTRRSTATPEGAAGLATRIMAYLGAIFILAGAIGMIELLWPSMGAAARVTSTYGSGLIALILALVAIREPRIQVAATPLFLISGLLQTAGLFVFLGQYWPGGDSALGAVTVFTVMAIQSAILSVTQRRTSLLFLCLLFATGAVAAALAWLDVDEGLSAFVIGVSGVMVTWKIDATDYRAIAPLAWTGYGFSMAAGAFDLLESWFPFDFALIGLAAMMIHLGVMARSRALLVTAVICMLGYLGYFTGEYFAELLSWPVALVLLGIAMLSVSACAVRLGGRIKPAERP